jgi:hypothetical protein
LDLQQGNSMTPTSDPIISSLGKKAAEFFRTYRIAGLKAVEDAARDHDDVIDIYATQRASYVAGSWESKFGRREAASAIYQLAALVAAVILIPVNAWGMWLAYSNFGFSTLGRSAASIACIATLGLFSLATALVLFVSSRQVSCKVCLAVSLWTRGWTPVSMEWFGADSGATWGLGAKNIYVWQKSFDGWGKPELRVIRYQDIHMMGDPKDFRNFLALSLDFELPQPRTEWLRFPEASNGMTTEQLTGEIMERASSFGREVKLHERKQEDRTEEAGEVITLYPPIRPPASCWRLIH